MAIANPQYRSPASFQNLVGAYQDRASLELNRPSLAADLAKTASPIIANEFDRRNKLKAREQELRDQMSLAIFKNELDIAAFERKEKIKQGKTSQYMLEDLEDARVAEEQLGLPQGFLNNYVGVPFKSMEDAEKLLKSVYDRTQSRMKVELGEQLAATETDEGKRIATKIAPETAAKEKLKESGGTSEKQTPQEKAAIASAQQLINMVQKDYIAKKKEIPDTLMPQVQEAATILGKTVEEVDVGGRRLFGLRSPKTTTVIRYNPQNAAQTPANIGTPQQVQQPTINQGQLNFNSIEEAEAANLPPGTIILIKGRRAVIQ